MLRTEVSVTVGESVKSVLKKKMKVTVERICRKGRFWNSFRPARTKPKRSEQYFCHNLYILMVYTLFFYLFLNIGGKERKPVICR